MVQVLIIISILILIIQSACESRTVDNKFKFNRVISRVKEDDQPKRCNELSPPLLNDILGAAFNSRYMSIDAPKLDDELEQKNVGGKRDAKDVKPFYVDDTYAEEISDKPAWEVSHLVNSTETSSTDASAQSQRIQRSTYRRRNDDSGGYQQSKRPWECEAKIKWLDLGYDYYPRYLRTVECTRHACFYGHFTCKPRSFTVKILRRRRGECVQTKNKIGNDGLHGDLRELWVWEERAVNFCCDCAAK